MKKALLLACIGMLSIQQIQSSSNLPQGSYLQSCVNCVMEGTKLNCICKTIYDRGNNTSINASQCASGLIANTNGNLTCAPIMQGSYLESCHNCTIIDYPTNCSQCFTTDNHAYCYCPKNNNKLIYTGLNLSKCPTEGTIQNIDGHLCCLTGSKIEHRGAAISEQDFKTKLNTVLNKK